MPSCGKTLDIGAGNGFTASALKSNDRILYPMEPSEGMKDYNQDLIWSKGVAQEIPFHSDYFDGIYSTWAYFLWGDSREDLGIEKHYEF